MQLKQSNLDDTIQKKVIQTIRLRQCKLDKFTQTKVLRQSDLDNAI